MSTQSKFYIELAKDEWGNTLYPKCVLEAIEEGERSLRVLAPGEIKSNWPTLRKGDFIECDGPAGVLAFDEWLKRATRAAKRL